VSIDVLFVAKYIFADTDGKNIASLATQECVLSAKRSLLKQKPVTVGLFFAHLLVIHKRDGVCPTRSESYARNVTQNSLPLAENKQNTVLKNVMVYP